MGPFECQVALFTPADAEVIRTEVGPALLHAFDDVALKLVGDAPPAT